MSLRLAGEVGQRTLDHVAGAGPAAKAELDQHIAAVRAAIAAYPMASKRRAAAVAGRAAADARTGLGRASSAARLSTLASNCPDVPFVADARTPERSLPIAMLLHYICGFLEEAVTSDWWPEADQAACPDWESMRLAAVCQLVAEAEAAADLHPDLSSPG